MSENRLRSWGTDCRMIAVLIMHCEVAWGGGDCITHTFTYTPTNERMLSRELCYFGGNYRPKLCTGTELGSTL